MADPKPSDVGFGYIAENQPREQYATVRSNTENGQPLKSAMKTPGTAGRLLNPLSPTFKQEMDLERQEDSTDKEQARDLVCQYSAFGLKLTITRKSRQEFEWRRLC